MSAIKSSVLAALVLVMALGLWFAIGFYPQKAFNDLGQAGQYGDSFGFVNSLFSSFAFAFVVVALLLQMKELHDATKTQEQQGRLQLKQMEIAERTARIQEKMRLDSRQKLAMNAFLKISRDSLRFKHAFLAWHPDNNKPLHSQMVDQETDRRLKKDYFDAQTELRSNCLGIGLLFDKRGDVLGQAIQELYVIAHKWVEMKSGFPAGAECEDSLNRQIVIIEQAMRPLWQELIVAD